MTITYGKQYIDKLDEKSVISTLRSKKLTQGPQVTKFEKVLNKKFGSRYSCAVINGTAGLHLCGLALGWKKNDIILCSVMSFLAASNAVIYCGATPVFIDINEKDFNIDLIEVEKKIKKYNKYKRRVKALIATDFAGNPCDWKKLSLITKKFNVKLINDNCHAIGAKYYYKKNYASKYADIAVHSYHAVKNITTGEGGAVLTNDKKIHDKVKILRSHGVLKTKIKEKPWNYQMKYLGFNYRITDIQCSLGISQLKKLDKFVKKRNEIAKIYRKNFEGKNFFKTQYVKENNYHAYHLFPLLINFKKIGKKKWKLFDFLAKKNIFLQVHYTPIHLQPFYMKNFGYKKGDFPIAEKFFEDEISLPIYYNLSIKQVNKICYLIKAFLLRR